MKREETAINSVLVKISIYRYKPMYTVIYFINIEYYILSQFMFFPPR